MANRSYLYSLSNRPSSYADRPETISGLSQWAYDVPYMYRLLMSGDPQLCASLVSDGFDSDEPEHKTKLHAISSRFDLGFERVKRFVDIVGALTAQAVPREPQSTAMARQATFIRRLQRLFSPQEIPNPTASTMEAPTVSTELRTWLDETVAFLEAHRDKYLLLETIELDIMSGKEEAVLRAYVEEEIARCTHVGAAIDALPADITEAGRQLKIATAQKCAAPLDAFFGLRLDDECDSVEPPLGLDWSEGLYFGLWNRAEFEVARMFAGEPYDRPACVDPVLAAFGRMWNEDMGSDEERKQLKRYIVLLPGTAQGDALSQRRGWLAVDWVIRVNTPAWLDLSPALAEHAAKLRALAPVLGEQQLADAQPTLDQARSAAAAGDAAEDAASAAAMGATRAAAWDAAWAAARAASGAAAWDAAGAAAWEAAGAAAMGAAWGAAQEAEPNAVAQVAYDTVCQFLDPTTKRLQEDAHELYLRMLNEGEPAEFGKVVC